MRYWINKYRCRWVLPLSLMLMVALVGKAQSARYTRVDIFMGAELHYRDLFHNKVYEALVNLTPGIKWYMGNPRLFHLSFELGVPFPYPCQCGMGGNTIIGNQCVTNISNLNFSHF